MNQSPSSSARPATREDIHRLRLFLSRGGSSGPTGATFRRHGDPVAGAFAQSVMGLPAGNPRTPQSLREDDGRALAGSAEPGQTRP